MISESRADPSFTLYSLYLCTDSLGDSPLACSRGFFFSLLFLWLFLWLRRVAVPFVFLVDPLYTKIPPCRCPESQAPSYFFPSNARWLSPGRLSSRKDNCILQIHRINAVATLVITTMCIQKRTELDRYIL